MTTRKGVTEQAAVAAIDGGCRTLRLPTIRSRFSEVAAAAERELGESGERLGKVGGPRPRRGQAQVAASAAVGDAGGDVQDPVAQPFGFGGGQLAVKQQHLGPGEQVAGGQGEFQPGGVDREDPGREAAEAGVLAAANAVLHVGVAAVADLKILDGSRPDRGVGGDDLMAQALNGVEQVQLRTGVWAFPAHDQPGSRREPVQNRRCDEVGDLDDLGAVAQVPIGLQRRDPGGGHRDRVPDRLGHRHPDGEECVHPKPAWRRMCARNACEQPAVSARMSTSTP